MENGQELYTGAMYGVINAVQSGTLKKNHNHQEHWDTVSDSVPSALIDTGHEPLIKLLLSGEEVDYKIITEVLYGYLRNGQLDKVVSILHQFPDRVHGFELHKFIETLVSSNADNSLILNLAAFTAIEKEDRHSDSNGSYYLRALIKSLWRAKKYDLAQSIIVKFVTEKEKPYMLLLEKIVKGESVSPDDVTQAIEMQCPLKPKGKRNWGDYLESSTRTKEITWFLSSFNELEAPIELLRVILEAHAKRMKSDQMEHMSSTYDIEKKIRTTLLERGDFDGAENFAREAGFGHWSEEEVLNARISHAMKIGDKETHRRVSKRKVEIQETQIKDLMERAKLESEEEIIAKAEWRTRVEYYELRAQQSAEQAIYELSGGDASLAQPHIESMIAIVEKIAIPPREGCVKKHLGTLRRRSRLLKRSIRERFLESGIYDALPAKGGWNGTILVSSDQRLERKRKNRGNREQNRNQETEESNKIWQAQETKKEMQMMNEMRTLVATKGPVAAIALLKEQFEHRYARISEWNRAIIILEAAPDRFEELNQLLSEKYFEDSYRSRDDAHDGLVAFYLAGKKLGVVDEKGFQDLFDKWRKKCWTPDGERPMTNKGVTSLVKGLLEDGKWEDALRYFKQLEQTKKLTRRTAVECLTALIRTASENLKDANTGVSVAFKGESLKDTAQIKEKVEYWNSQIEILLATKDESSYLIAYKELVQNLDTPDGIQTLIKLMALGSIRTTHQKKDVLTTAHTLNTASQEARIEIVSAMIDHDITGAEAMPEVKSKDTPMPMAIMLFKKLIDKKILHKHTANFLDENGIPYLRRLLSQYQNQFNTVMETLERDIREQEMNPKKWEGIFAVLSEVGVFTPGIYAQAKACNYNKRELKGIGEKLAKLKKDIFSNRPIDGNATPELVAELVYIAYQPVNMSYYTVVDLCQRVRDCSHQLDKYTFPEDGYALDLTGNKTMLLRKGLTLSTPSGIYKKPDYSQGTPSRENPNLTIVSQYLDEVRALCKFGRLKLEEVGLSDFLVVLDDDGFMKSALAEYAKATSGDTAYRGLRLLQEALGVYLTDNLEAAIREFLRKDKRSISKTLEALAESIKKPGMKKVFSSQLGIEIDESKSDIKLTAQIIAKIILQKFKPLKNLQKMIADDLKKFTSEGNESVSNTNVKLRAVISKNKASFFAKASAGICTAEDTELFHREDHFHINIIDDEKEKCVGNIQAYIMQHEGRPHLLLRGFNPSTSVLKDADAGSLSEAIIAVGEQFAEENGLAGVLLSEQGGFLALSNRPEVRAYIEKTYGNNIKEIEKYNITSHYTISAAYAVKGSKRTRPPEHLRKRLHQEDEGESVAA